MLAKVYSCAVIGLEAAIVEVEVDTTNGLPSFVELGPPEAEPILLGAVEPGAAASDAVLGTAAPRSMMGPPGVGRGALGALPTVAGMALVATGALVAR
jgi:hypothetical protein